MKNIAIATIGFTVILFAGFIFVNSQALKKESQLKDSVVVPTPEVQAAATANPQDAKITEMKTEDIVVGTGQEATNGKKVTVHYTGTLTSGTKFDSSLDRNQPFTFTLGAGEVIKGWDLGVKGMKVGGKRKLTVPSDLGYGPNGAPPVIPPNAALVFEVEVLKVE